MDRIAVAMINHEGRVKIPIVVREELGISEGQELLFMKKEGQIVISKLPEEMKQRVEYYLAKGFDRKTAEYYARGKKTLIAVLPNPDFSLTLMYEDNERRWFDCKPLLQKGGVFAHLRKYSNFERVFVNYHAVCWDIDPNVDSNEVWENRIDLCPDSTYLNSKPLPIYDVRDYTPYLEVFDPKDGEAIKRAKADAKSQLGIELDDEAALGWATGKLLGQVIEQEIHKPRADHRGKRDGRETLRGDGGGK